MNALEMLLETTPMRALGWTLLHFVWQGSALYVVHALLQVGLRRQSASTRYVASCLVLVAMIASAGVTLRLESQRMPVGVGNVLAQSAALEDPTQRLSGEPAREGATPPAVPATVSDPHSITHRLSHVASHHSQASPLQFLQAAAPHLDSLLPWMVSLWFIGVFLLTTRLAIGWQEARWLRQRAVRPVGESFDAAWPPPVEPGAY
jgi:hypothetical protein